MKQIIMCGPRKSRVADVPVPKIGDNELLVKVRYTGMCHSEWYPWATAKENDVLGHETIGTVARVGKSVKGFREGDRVTGLGGGGYKEYIVMEPGKTIHVPDNLKDEDAIVEPLACLLSATSNLPPKLLGDEIAVVGAGYMGLGAISLFRLMGYGRIVAIDPRPEARRNALRFGATDTYAPDLLPEGYLLDWPAIGKPDLTRDGHKTDLMNTGFQTVMEFAGTASALKLAGDMVSAHGRLGIGGYHNDGPRTLDFQLWNFKAFTAVNCHERRIEHETTLCRRCIDMLASGQWGFKGLATHIYRMEEFDRANADMETKENGFVKGLVLCE